MSFSNLEVSNRTPEIDLRETTNWKNCQDAYKIGYHELWLDNIIKTGDIWSKDGQLYEFKSVNYVETTHYDRDKLHAGDILTFKSACFDMALFVTEVENDSKILWSMYDKPPTYTFMSPFSTARDTNGRCYNVCIDTSDNRETTLRIINLLTMRDTLQPSNVSEYSHSRSLVANNMDFVFKENLLSYKDSIRNPTFVHNEQSEVILPTDLPVKSNKPDVSDFDCTIHGVFSVHRTKMLDGVIDEFQCLNFELCFWTQIKHEYNAQTDENDEQGPNLSFGNLKYFSSYPPTVTLSDSDTSWFYQGGGFLFRNEDIIFDMKESFHIYSPRFFTKQE